MKNQMKTKLLIAGLLIVLISACSFAQKSISTDVVQYCDWNEDLEQWENCEVLYDTNTLFVINESQTMITHTMNSGKSVYYIIASELTYNDKQEKIWHYSLNSDTGMLYQLFINPTDRTVKAVYSGKDGIKGGTYYIKTIY